MDPKQISSLAKLLRDRGDTVLNSEYKLSLSGQMLRTLNNSFILILDETEMCAPQTFQVVKADNSNSDVFRDLQFLHDFFQKTLILNINQLVTDEKLTGTVDISKFRSLRKLEIQRIEIGCVLGLQQLRSQLREIVCNKCLRSISDIILDCGGDKTHGFIWNELKVADFSYNALTRVDNSLEFTPWLQILNLSHNKIVSVDAIKWLPSLKVLNLSYNCLDRIPAFHLDASKRLQIINLKNNYIEDLTGLSRLDFLNELDLSDNYLIDHSHLIPLSSLAALTYLNLANNPLACHPKHREATARYLHHNTSTVHFVLDAHSLTNSEKNLTGHYPSYNFILKSRLSRNNSPASSVIRAPEGRSSRESSTPQSSVGSIISTGALDVEISQSTSSTLQKRLRVRQAIIADDDRTEEVNQPMPTTVDVMTASIEGNKEHLETKKQIETLREQYGDTWLHSESGHLVQSLIGMESSFGPKDGTSSEQLIETFLFEIENEKAVALSSTPLKNSLSAVPPDYLESPEPSDAFKTEYNSVVDESHNELQSVYKSTIDETAKDFNDVYNTTETEQSVSDVEDNETPYFVIKLPSNKEAMIVVSNDSIREKDAMSGRTRVRWGLKMLESCECLQSSVLQIKFDTLVKMKRERTYKLESPESCTELKDMLRNILSQRPLSEMNQTLFRCANCATQFSRENVAKKSVLVPQCPQCHGKFVIELKDSPTMQPAIGTAIVDNEVATDAVETLPKSLSDASIAQPVMDVSCLESLFNDKHKISSASSLNESSSCSRISNSESSFDSNQSVAGSSGNERDNDLDLMARRRGGGADSDIEILSNPSQSSIEVLDSIHRKLSEERRISRAPSLDRISDKSVGASTAVAPFSLSAVPDQLKSSKTLKTLKDCTETVPNSVLTALNLTESSSSGSITDSVCTAYDQQRNGNDVAKKEKSSIKDVSLISNMLGGLFQSTNLFLSKTPAEINTCDALTENTTFEPFHFSYTNFSSVDHRLKLFLYQSNFEDASEHLKWLVRGRVYDESVKDEYGSGFDGILLMSTTKFYVFQMTGNECDDLSKWLRKHLSVTVDRVGVVQVLPWKIGLTFRIKRVGSVHLILGDIMRTDSLLSHFADNPLPDQSTIDYTISEYLTQRLSLLANGSQMKMIAILPQCKIDVEGVKTESENWNAIIVTNTHLYLTITNFRWLCDGFTNDMEISRTQAMYDLVEAEKTDAIGVELTIKFVSDNKENEVWRCEFETDACADSTLAAIAQSWETIFGVPFGN